MTKKMNKKSYIPLALLILMSFITSCERDDICPENSMTTPGARVEFYTTVTGREEATDGSHLMFYGMMGDDTLFRKAPGGNYITLPLDFEKEESLFLVVKDTVIKDPANGMVIERIKLQDTLTFKYEPQLTFVSKACGYCFTYKSMTVEATTGGSIGGLVAVIEGEPSYGELLSSRQTVAKIYINKKD